MARADAVLVFKEDDRRVLIGAGLLRPVVIIDPPLQAPTEDPKWARRSQNTQQNVLLTGAFDRPENYRSAIWFLDEVWPTVETHCPEARCIIAGNDPPECLHARATSKVIITGYVSSLSPLYEDADVFVAPLLAGAGLKFKIPQAMLYGLPVVATPIAVEGVIEEAGLTAFAAITRDPELMARSVIDLLAQPDLLRSVGERAQRWATARYDFRAATERVLDLYARFPQGSTTPWVEQTTTAAPPVG